MPTTKTSNIDFFVLKHISGPFQEKEMIKDLKGFVTISLKKKPHPRNTMER